jgi:hypothetical protein
MSVCCRRTPHVTVRAVAAPGWPQQYLQGLTTLRVFLTERSVGHHVASDVTVPARSSRPRKGTPSMTVDFTFRRPSGGAASGELVERCSTCSRSGGTTWTGRNGRRLFAPQPSIHLLCSETAEARARTAFDTDAWTASEPTPCRGAGGGRQRSHSSRARTTRRMIRGLCTTPHECTQDPGRET